MMTKKKVEEEKPPHIEPSSYGSTRVENTYKVGGDDLKKAILEYLHERGVCVPEDAEYHVFGNRDRFSSGGDKPCVLFRWTRKVEPPEAKDLLP